jgi:hypothetical protein
LYEYAEKAYIDVEYSHDVKDVMGVSDKTSYGHHISLNPLEMIRSEILEKACLAHEIGHCETGTIHNSTTPRYQKKWFERRAWRWAFKKLVPECQIEEAMEHGVYEMWDLADYFSVPNWFMYHAVCYYKGICTDVELGEDMWAEY